MTALLNTESLGVFKIAEINLAESWSFNLAKESRIAARVSAASSRRESLTKSRGERFHFIIASQLYGRLPHLRRIIMKCIRKRFCDFISFRPQFSFLRLDAQGGMIRPPLTFPFRQLSQDRSE